MDQTQTLDDRMKAYERELNFKIPPYKPFIARLDGRSFSKFTKGLKSPFDNNFVTAMVDTMNDLVLEFNAHSGYTHSDEITLIFLLDILHYSFLVSNQIQLNFHICHDNPTYLIYQYRYQLSLRNHKQIYKSRNSDNLLLLYNL